MNIYGDAESEDMRKVNGKIVELVPASIPLRIMWEIAFKLPSKNHFVDGNVVVVKGSDVYGRLAESKESGTFSGRSQLRLELTGIVVNGKQCRWLQENTN